MIVKPIRSKERKSGEHIHKTPKTQMLSENTKAKNSKRTRLKRTMTESKEDQRDKFCME